MPATQQDKAERFRELHERPGSFVIPNPWDGASAKILAALGFQALATSSGACAAVLGRLDGHITRDEALAHSALIVSATGLPVSADLEKGFGDTAEDAAEMIRLAAEVGLVGASIEDSTGDPSAPIFPFELAAERIAAAARIARGLPFPFMLSARAQNFAVGVPDLDDTIRRLQAFEKAGADVLFAPALPTLDAVRAVCAAVSKPVNFMVAIPGKSFSVADLEAAGVKRISLATSLYRAAMGGLFAAAKEVAESGTFGYLDVALPSSELSRYIQGNATPGTA